jgi:uncharacterized protein YutE (UPF0331/DUF86 family)
MSDISQEDFHKNRERQYAILHALQLAIEASIEIGTHICSADALGIPGSYAETFDLLEQGGIVTPELSSKLRTMARFRNRIVHFYWEVDLDEVYRILSDNLGDLDEYLAAIELYIAPPGASDTAVTDG